MSQPGGQKRQRCFGDEAQRKRHDQRQHRDQQLEPGVRTEGPRHESHSTAAGTRTDRESQQIRSQHDRQSVRGVRQRPRQELEPGHLVNEGRQTREEEQEQQEERQRTGSGRSGGHCSSRCPRLAAGATRRSPRITRQLQSRNPEAPREPLDHDPPLAVRAVPDACAPASRPRRPARDRRAAAHRLPAPRRAPGRGRGSRRLQPGRSAHPVGPLLPLSRAR